MSVARSGGVKVPIGPVGVPVPLANFLSINYINAGKIPLSQLDNGDIAIKNDRSFLAPISSHILQFYDYGRAKSNYQPPL